MPNYTPTGVRLLGSTPRQDGFYFPAEDAVHEYTIMAFVPAQNWADNGLWDAQEEWAATANAVSEFEPVLMVVDPSDRAAARQLLSSDIEQIEFPLNDGWSRDTGPIVLVNPATRERRIAGFTFNGWGAKFPPYNDDALLKAYLGAELGWGMYAIDLIMEGGGIIHDGEGTIITTEQCLLHRNRNPGWTKADVEAVFRDYLGAEKTIWLGKGLVPDPVTDGHVDGIAAYVEPGVVLLYTTDDRSDPNYAICQDAKARLSRATDAQGRRFEIVEMPLGSVVHMGFYLVNGGVIVPIAEDPDEDDEPLAILQEVFPEREVVGVPGVVLAEGGGSVHCITQQVPRV
ncbi:MAG: agmatine deiminase family protein [Spirulina sp. SIO3F2]|nr:agmatine deiminase family protein [Spirulina sp. SIO3F2]